MSNQGAQLLTPQYDTGTGKLFIGDGDDFPDLQNPTEAAYSRNNPLRKAITQAKLKNPNNKNPWIAPAAYANSTALSVGQMVAANGNWYVVQTAGTTASSGTGPSAITAASITDGTVVFNWAGMAKIAASDSMAPTVTLGTVNPVLGQTFKPLAYPDKFKVFGADHVAYRTDFWELKSFNTASATKASRGAVVSFSTDAPKLAIFIPSNTLQCRIYVDDGEGARYLQQGAYYIGGSDSHLTIDWTSTSGRKDRTYFVETNKSYGYFGYVQVTNSDQIWQNTSNNELTGVWISDSYSGGHNYTVLPGCSVAGHMAKNLGITNFWNMSTGGTGYIATASGTAYNYLQRAQDSENLAKIATADFIGIMGSTNDTGQAVADIKAQVKLTLSAIRTATKTKQVPIVVVGVPSINLTDTADMENAIYSAITELADSFIFFVPISTLSIPWVTGSWNKTNTPGGTGDNSGMYISSDNTHPTDFGNKFYADRITNAVLSALA